MKNYNEQADEIESRHHKTNEDNSLVNNALDGKQSRESLLNSNFGQHNAGSKNADVVKIDNYTVPVENEGMLKIAQKLTNNITTADDYPKPKPASLDKPKPKPVNDEIDEKVKKIQEKEETKEKKVGLLKSAFNVLLLRQYLDNTRFVLSENRKATGAKSCLVFWDFNG